MTQALLCCFVLRLGSFREVEGALGIPDSTSMAAFFPSLAGNKSTPSATKPLQNFTSFGTWPDSGSTTS